MSLDMDPDAVDPDALEVVRLLARGYSVGPINRKIDKALRPLHAAGILQRIHGMDGKPWTGTHTFTVSGRAWVRMVEEGALYHWRNAVEEAAHAD